jgi:hypothetical protein
MHAFLKGCFKVFHAGMAIPAEKSGIKGPKFLQRIIACHTAMRKSKAHCLGFDELFRVGHGL